MCLVIFQLFIQRRFDQINYSEMAGNISYWDQQSNSMCSSFDCYSIDLDFESIYDQIDPRENTFLFDVFLLSILSFFGVIGNTGLLLSVCRSPRLRTSANILLTNLVAGDLLYILISVPFFVEHERHPSWQFGSTLCKLINAGEITAQGVCVFSITSLSVERYTVLVRDTTVHRFVRRYRRWFAICIIWTVSIATAVPVLLLAETRGSRCDYLPIADSFTKVYEIGRLIVLYVFPMITIAWFYLGIAKTLFVSAGEFASESQPGVRHFNARKRLAITVLIIAVFFGLFWMPYYLHVILFRFHPHFGSHGATAIYRRMYYFAALSNSCLNPWIVYVMSSTYRAIVVDFLSCRKKMSSNSVSFSRYPQDKAELRVMRDSQRRRYSPPKSTRISEV
ncbi:phe13-bombesin receptor-like [Apostichopus japonicus]|uniref:phe13-bombesin receptor-like n=1 Tax=Stichopus japonicus TaxID=307972 RepID=UPI003AB58DA5